MSTPPGTPTVTVEPATLPCVECGDETYNIDRNPVLRRDCNLTRMIDEAVCSECWRMRIQADDAVGLMIWGQRCECDPATTPTVYDARNA